MTRAIVEQAAKEVFGRVDAGAGPGSRSRSAALVGLGVVGGVALFAAATLAYNGATKKPAPAPAPVATAASAATLASTASAPMSTPTLPQPKK